MDEKVVLLTGGSRGIGSATARELARRGARPVLAGTSGDALARVAGEIPPTPLTVELDVTSTEQREEAVERTLAAVITGGGSLSPYAAPRSTKARAVFESVAGRLKQIDGDPAKASAPASGCQPAPRCAAPVPGSPDRRTVAPND